MKSMEWIDNIIIGLLDIYKTNNIYEIYDLLKISIIELNANNILLQNNEALYNRNYFNNEVVFLKNNLSVNYKKFILAHELGHALIHTSLLNAAFNINLINIGKLEKQANYFALKFLNINIDCIEFQDLTVDQISSCLEIPTKLLKELKE